MPASPKTPRANRISRRLLSPARCLAPGAGLRQAASAASPSSLLSGEGAGVGEAGRDGRGQVGVEPAGDQVTRRGALLAGWGDGAHDMVCD